MVEIKYIVKRGKYSGKTAYPHVYAGNPSRKFVVSKTNKECDYIWVDSIEKIISYLDKGYMVRVSVPNSDYKPSLVSDVIISP